MEQKRTLGLSIPERTAAPAESFLVSPKEVKSWINTLPMANVGETSRQIFKSIVEFNRLEIPSLARIKVAEQFIRPIDYISDNLRKYYFDAPFPLSAKNKKIAVLNRELYSELTISYKTFIENMISGAAGKFDRKLMVIAVHRALKCLSLVIYQSVVVYDPYPNGIWKEINLLYAYAEKNKIQNLPVKDSNNQTETSSISELYKQILLFAISSPYRLRQREIDQVYMMLPNWVSQISLSMPDPDNTGGSIFISRLRSDLPPSHIELQTKDISKRCRQLDTHKLVQILREEFDQLPDNGAAMDSRTEIQLSKHLLRQLIQVFSSAPKREFVRTKLNFELKTAVGLTAVHTLLSMTDQRIEQPAQFSTGEMGWIGPNEQENKQALYTRSTQELTLGSISDLSDENTILIGDTEIASGGDGVTPPGWIPNEANRSFETFSCKTVNESAGGYCINWYGPNAPKIKIGEVLGIQSATNRGQFGIGISRWLKNSPGQGLLLGMEMIAPSSHAVQVKQIGDNSVSDYSQKCLLLPELKSSGQPASLVTPTLPFKVGDTIAIDQGQGVRQARLTRLLESTGAFAQFQFIYLDTPADSNGESEQEDEDFDNIWSML